MNHLTIQSTLGELDANITATVGAGTLVAVVPLQNKGWYTILWTP